MKIKNITLQYHKQKEEVFDDACLNIYDQKWTCLIGESGCGKSSLLKLIAGLINSDNADLSFNTDNNKCSVSYMPQDDTLFPWMTVIQNVTFFHRCNDKHHLAKHKEKAEKILFKLGILDISNKYPDYISGGQRQRVSLARTLILDREVVLMDEPFSKLDALTRLKLQNLALTNLKNKTVLCVTHDPQEAIRLSDSLYLIKNKKIIAVQLPLTQPPRPYDAHFYKTYDDIFSKLESK